MPLPLPIRHKHVPAIPDEAPRRIASSGQEAVVGRAPRPSGWRRPGPPGGGRMAGTARGWPNRPPLEPPRLLLI